MNKERENVFGGGKKNMSVTGDLKMWGVTPRYLCSTIIHSRARWWSVKCDLMKCIYLPDLNTEISYHEVVFSINPNNDNNSSQFFFTDVMKSLFLHRFSHHSATYNFWVQEVSLSRPFAVFLCLFNEASQLVSLPLRVTSCSSSLSPSGAFGTL